ncbi:titin-like [Ostrinia nubilalis]|uniref:titin-like n=1 Tax=Ostrinia nubilalis TaxID=29057 RepID=UPI00308230B8
MDASKNVTVLSVVKIPPVNLVKEVEKHLTLNKENKQVVSLEKPALEKAKIEKLNENEDKPKPERKRARRLNVPPGKSVSAEEVDMYLTNEYEDEIEQPHENKENSTQVELQKKRINRSNLPRKCELAKDTESLSTKEDQDRAKEHNENITQCEYECVKLRNLLLGQKIPEDVEIDLTNEEEEDNYVTPPRDLTSLEEVNMNLLEELNKKKINCPRSLSEEGENNKKCQLPVIRAIRFELPPGKSVSAKDVEVILKNKEDELKNKYYHTTKH